MLDHDSTTSDTDWPYGYGFCHCGCGERTKTIRADWPEHGRVKGQPNRYVLNHHRRRDPAKIAADFWSRVDKAPGQGPQGTCWLWTAGCDGNGYGAFKWLNVQWKAHRLAWFLTTGEELDPSVFLCHHCDNPPCVCPDHLFPGTALDNMRDRDSKGRRANPNAKLSPDDIRAIRRLSLGGRSRVGLAPLFGVSSECIGHVATGRTWKDIL